MILVSLGFSLAYATACAFWPGSDGRSAATLTLLNLALFFTYSLIKGTKERAFLCLLLSAAVLGAVALIADHLCIRFTGTLDYSVSKSFLILSSPWWMPLAWMVVSVQVGILGDAFICRFGQLRGALLCGALGALLIPFYEEMAWGANWWRYENCLLISRTPLYIIVCEAFIGAGIALWGYWNLRQSNLKASLVLGLAAGVLIIFSGILGWGLVEFLARGARPLSFKY